MTHTAKHTPGPWYAANMGNDFQGLVVEEPTGKNIAVVYDKRDVHILAAAPAMYEALQEALKCIEKHVPKTEFAPRQWIREVLAQAEGRQA